MRFGVVDAIWSRSCDLVSHMRFGVVDAIWSRSCDLVSHMRFGAGFGVRLVGHQIADASNRICDLQQIAHEIAHEIARVISP
jgi:hypothetical protein